MELERKTSQRRIPSRAGRRQVDSTGPQLRRSANPADLQRRLGNRGVQAWIGIQKKLTISQPGDRYEREADDISNRIVTGRSVPAISRLGTGTERYIERVGHNAKETTSVPGSLERSIQQAKGGGHRLSEGVRRSMESAFGVDFHGVKIHTGEESDRLNQALNADAFTIGPDIFFSMRSYNPASKQGQKLLAHELTHVLQQGNLLARIIQRRNLYSGGFDGYPSVRQEIQAISSGIWQPTTPDFAATAQGGTPITQIGQLIGWIDSQATNAIRQINLIGHSNPNDFAFGGSIVTSTGAVMLNIGQGLTVGNLQAYESEILRRNLRDRFAENASISLYSCYTGAGQELLQAIANAFQVPAKGFTSALNWCIRYTPANTLEGRGEVTTGTCPGQVGLGHLAPDVTVNP